MCFIFLVISLSLSLSLSHCSFLLVSFFSFLGQSLSLSRVVLGFQNRLFLFLFLSLSFSLRLFSSNFNSPPWPSRLFVFPTENKGVGGKIAQRVTGAFPHRQLKVSFMTEISPRNHLFSFADSRTCFNFLGSMCTVIPRWRNTPHLTLY